MNPIKFKSLYMNVAIQASCAPGAAREPAGRVAIRRYRNASINYSAAEKARVVGHLRQRGYSGTDRTAVARCFNGKAAVSEFELAVSAIFVEGFAPQGMQQYCDAHLGLDCSGFVNNYFVSVHGLVERPIGAYYQAGRRRLRTAFDQFRAKDVLIWCSPHGAINDGSGRHIAVVDSVGAQAGSELRAVVVESSGTVGLVDSTYTFIETRTRGVYRVHRPLKPGTNNHVRVVPVV